MYDYKASGAIIRSKANWIANGEKNSKYFLGLEKHKAELSTVNQLETKNGLIDDHNEVMNEIFAYQSNVYAQQSERNIEKINLHDFVQED